MRTCACVHACMYAYMCVRGGGSPSRRSRVWPAPLCVCACAHAHVHVHMCTHADLRIDAELERQVLRGLAPVVVLGHAQDEALSKSVSK